MDRIEQLEQRVLQLARRESALQVSVAALQSVQQLLAAVARDVSLDAAADHAGPPHQHLLQELHQLTRSHAELIGRVRSDSHELPPVQVECEAAAAESTHDVLTHAVIEAAVIGIVMIDDRGVVTAFNPAAQRIFGYRPDEVIGRNVHLLMSEPERSQHDEYLRQYLQTGKARIIGVGREVCGRRKDGTEIPLELAVSELRIGGRRSFVGMVQDITSLKQAEQALRTSAIEPNRPAASKPNSSPA